jgi:SAM-dependent methyltransferase
MLQHNKILILVYIFQMFILATAFAEKSNEEIFTDIYDNKTWGQNQQGQGHSGEGSTIAATHIYRVFLQEFLKEHSIRSVVDVGCGDWEFSKKINWEGIYYQGFDVVKAVIQNNQQIYASDTIQFTYADATTIELPEADLLICKDVLQHLPNEDISQFLSQLHKFKHCLITNDINPRTYTSHNKDIKRGGIHPIDLTKPPFSLKGFKILTYKSQSKLKQVLHYRHDHPYSNEE